MAVDCSCPRVRLSPCGLPWTAHFRKPGIRNSSWASNAVGTRWRRKPWQSAAGRLTRRASTGTEKRRAYERTQGEYPDVDVQPAAKDRPGDCQRLQPDAQRLGVDC